MIVRVPGSVHDHYSDEELANYDPSDDWHEFRLWLPSVTDPNDHFAAVCAALDAAGISYEAR